MQGTIIAYSDAVNAGYIRGLDGKNYQFSRSEWRSLQAPENNGDVNFIGDTGRAQQVHTNESRVLW